MADKGKKIILAGGACTGKTTLGKALCKVYPQFIIPLETVRNLCDRYHMDFANGNAGLQLAGLYEETKLLMDSNNYFLDGVCIGSRSYTQYYRERGKCDMDEATYAFYCDAIREQLRENADLIIFCRSGEIPIVADGFRIVDAQYTHDVDVITEELIRKMGLQDKTVIPHGSVEERVNFCKPFIDSILY